MPSDTTPPGSEQSGGEQPGEQPEPVSRRELRARESQETTELPTRRRMTSGNVTERLYAAAEPAATAAPAATDAAPAFHQERTVRPLPIMLAVAGGVLALVAALLVAGLAAKSNPPVASSPTPSAVAAAPLVPPPAPATPAVTPPQRDAEANECVDSTGEGGAVDLEAASLSLEKGDLVARFQLVDALPAGASSVGIYATSRDGKRSYQLAATWNDGELDRFFVHDFDRDRDTRLDSRDLKVDGTSITAAFPDDIAKALGDGWGWYAFSTADGQDVDACPGAPLDFTTIPFESGSGNRD